MRHLILILCVLSWTMPATAQVTRDGSIGPSTPLAIEPLPDLVTGAPEYRITDDLGETQGGTLFHSFETFSINPGEIATFSGPSSIDTIISRTTGTLGSFINGTLRSTIPQAQLFFLSPNGLVIGQGAQLDVPGSVHFSTATVLRFGPDPTFDLPTNSLARPALLSSQPPSAFGFGPNPAPITVSADPNKDTPMDETLRVPSGETLSLVGGDVTLRAFPGSGSISFQGRVIGAPGANVEIASTHGNQDVPLRRVAGRSRLDLDQLPPDLLDGDVLFQTNVRIDVGAPIGTSDAAGSFVVRAGTFTIDDGRILATHRSDSVDAGSIDIGTRDLIELDQALIDTTTRAAGRGGDIRLASSEVSIGGSTKIQMLSFRTTGGGGDFSAEATKISLLDESRITSTSTGSGDGGTIVLEADAIKLFDSSGVLSVARGDPAAAGGALEIHTAELLVDSGSFVSSSTTGDAAGGAVTVEGLDGGAANSVIIHNAGGESEPARISTNTTSNNVTAGDGGSLTVRTGSLDLIDGGQMFARTEGSGDAGALVVVADSIRIAGVLADPSAPPNAPQDRPSGITSRVNEPGALGNGTLLSIDTWILEIENGGQISTATFGVGDAGDLRITSRERMTVSGGINGASLVSAQAVAGPAAGGGNGGLIEIETDRLELFDGGQITASTAGEGLLGNVGDAGNIMITAGSIEISGADPSGFDVSGVFSKSKSTAVVGLGQGGDVTFVVDGDLTLSDGVKIEVSSSFNGDAGNIVIDVDGSLRLESGAQILSTSTDQSKGNAGSVTIDAMGDVLLSGGSEIGASTGSQSSGNGGVVSVISDRNVQLTGGSEISSRSGGFGDAGDIEIEAQSFLASEGSAISTKAEFASGGSIAIDVAQLFELVDSGATTSVLGAVGTSDAGNVFIHTPKGLVVVDGSAVVAQANAGAGGQIEIFSASSFISGDSVIDASSQQGPQGEIKLTPPEDALISELASLPAALEDPSQLLRNACDLRTEREGSFTVRPRPPATAPPDQFLHPPLTDQVPSEETCTQ